MPIYTAGTTIVLSERWTRYLILYIRARIIINYSNDRNVIDFVASATPPGSRSLYIKKKKSLYKILLDIIMFKCAYRILYAPWCIIILKSSLAFYLERSRLHRFYFRFFIIRI